MTSSFLALAFAVLVPASARAQSLIYQSALGVYGTGSGQFGIGGPTSVAVDQYGNIYAVDNGNLRVQCFKPNGVFMWSSTASDSAGGVFGNPWGIAVDNSSNVYVSDPGTGGTAGTGRIVVLNANSGATLNQWYLDTIQGSTPTPMGLAVGATGYLLVADAINNRIEDYLTSPGNMGVFVSSFGSFGVTTPGEFNSPEGVAIDTGNYFYVADTGNHWIQVFTPLGQIFTQSAIGANSFQPKGISWAPGELFVSDPNGGQIQVFDTSGNFLTEFGFSSTPPQQLSSPLGLFAVSTSTLYVADSGNNRIVEYGTLGLGVPSSFPGVGYSTMAVIWTTSLPGSTVFTVNLAANPNFNPNFLSTTTTGTYAFFVGLSTNTRYYAEVSAPSGPTVSLGSRSTLADTPTSPAWTSIATNQGGGTWGPATNPVGTKFLFEASLSSSPFVSAVSVSTTSTSTTTVFGTITGLSSDTTYYIGVVGVNLDGVQTPVVVGGSTHTLINAPAAGAAPIVSSVTFQADWSANGDSTSTVYGVQIGTDPAFGTLTSSVTVISTYTVFSNLAPNTTYFTQVQAFTSAGQATSFVGLSSAATLAVPPSSASTRFLQVDATSSTVTWASLPASPSSATSEGFLLEASLTGAAPFISSATASPAVSTLSITGLMPNTTYFFQVGSLNWAGTGDFTTLGSTITLAAMPSSGTVSATTGTVTAGWNAGANPAGTVFEFQLSADPAYGSFYDSTTTASSISIGGLQADTTYYMRVRGLNSGGTPSCFLNIGPAVTLAPAPSALPESPVGARSITANWGASGSSLTYQAVISTSSGLSPALSVVTTTGTSAVFTGLTMNTQYFFGVASLNWSGQQNLTTLPSTATLACVPSSPTVTAIQISSAALVWVSSNPAGTLYDAQVLTYPNLYLFIDSQTLTPSATFQGLTPNTSYYAQVRTLGLNNTTVFTSTVGFLTLADAPTSPLVQATTGSVSVEWQSFDDPSWTVFEADLSTSPAFAGSFSSMTTTQYSASFGGLAALTTYYLRLSAFNTGGVQSPYLPVGVVVTTAAAPVGGPLLPGATTLAATWVDNVNPPGTVYELDLSTNGFTTLNVSSFTQNMSIVFGTGNGTGPQLLPDTTYYARLIAAGVTVQLGSTSTWAVPPGMVSVSSVTAFTVGVAWSSGPAAGPFDAVYTNFEADLSTSASFATYASTQTQGLSAFFSSLTAKTTYYARARAINQDGIPTAFAVGASTVTPPPPPTVQVSLGPGSASTVVEVTGPSGPMDLTFPAGAYNQAVSLTVQITNSFPPATSGVETLAGLGLGLNVIATPSIEPVQPVTLSIAYQPQNLGSANPASVLIGRFDTFSGQWAMLPTQLNASTLRLTATSSHLSLFQVLSVEAAASLGSASAFPNPFRPAQGATQLTFSNMPAGASIRVYTPLGELVRELTADATGRAYWDGRNEAGRTAASGLYLAHIQSGGSSTVIKVAIQR